jgi:hypothetical protein
LTFLYRIPSAYTLKTYLRMLYISYSWQRQRTVSRPALGSSQPPIQWVLGALFPGVKCSQGVMLTTHPLLVPRLRKIRSCTSSHLKRLHGMWRDCFTFLYILLLERIVWTILYFSVQVFLCRILLFSARVNAVTCSQNSKEGTVAQWLNILAVTITILIIFWIHCILRYKFWHSRIAECHWETSLLLIFWTYGANILFFLEQLSGVPFCFLSHRANILPVSCHFLTNICLVHFTGCSSYNLGTRRQSFPYEQK